jgi:hypothetical protein
MKVMSLKVISLILKENIWIALYFVHDVHGVNINTYKVGIEAMSLRVKRGCIQKFPDWPPGARTANGTALCH